MSLFDKNICKPKRESLELAEASRQKEWICPSYVACLFKGHTLWDMFYPFPEQSQEEKEKGDELLSKLENILKTKLDPDDVDITREIPKEVIQELFQIGAFAIKIPEEYNGLGLSQTNYDRAMHLVGSYCGSTAALLSAHQSIGVPQPLLDFGTEEQKKKFLPRFRKDTISGFALTEAEAGSDPRSMKTTAVPTEDGKYYLINGEKLWCTNGNIADILVVMAQTPPKTIKGKEKKQITAFIVETNTPGFSVEHRCKFMGLNAIQNGVLRFNNVKVPKENIILGEGQGLKLALITLNTGRLTLPAAVTGASKWCLYVARKWAAEREQWGSTIGEHEAISTKLSTMSANVFAMDAITWLTSYMAENKSFDIRIEAAMSKLFCTEESWKIVNDAVQIRGGRGYESAPSLKKRGKPAYPLERALRDSRVNTILEGSSEIMHLFIAREALDFHLKKIAPFMDPKIPILKKLVLAVSTGFAYITWYPLLWIPSFSFRKPKHISYVQRTSKKLARTIFHKMMRYQKKLIHKQNILNRIVDIGTDLFAISCACSYAETLACNNKDRKNALNLSDLFYRQARKRITVRFKELCRNDDTISKSISKELLAGKYKWLENDIIK